MNGMVFSAIFSLPSVIENPQQFLLLRTEILWKTVVGCPWCLSHRKSKKKVKDQQGLIYILISFSGYVFLFCDARSQRNCIETP